MRSEMSSAETVLELPLVVNSRDGYQFFPNSDQWRLNKDVAFDLSFLHQVSPEANLGFRLALVRYAEDGGSPYTLRQQRNHFRAFIHDTGTSTVTVEALFNWRGQLNNNSNRREDNEHLLSTLKGFFIAWYEWGFPGMPADVESLLRTWTLKNNEVGRAVAQDDPREGRYTDIELGMILDWANVAFSSGTIKLEPYAYILTLAMTARRTTQIAALRGIDLSVNRDSAGTPEFAINIPRAKQRNGGFRWEFRKLPVIEDLYLVLRAQHQASVAMVKAAIRCDVPGDIMQQVPIFINPSALKHISGPVSLRDVLLGQKPDQLHTTAHRLHGIIHICNKKFSGNSERTGEPIHLFATRFRRTRGTNLRREGFGPDIIAELLDHSDKKNVQIYTQNTVQEAEIINRLVAHKLAPFAQACMGTLVDSERDAIRGDDPHSRVPNHRQDAVGTCGNYGFCASGFKACYTCRHFQPWVDGPHTDVLNELYDEKNRLADAGCGPGVVSGNDRLILAVEHCVAICAEARENRTAVVQPIKVLPQDLRHE